MAPLLKELYNTEYLELLSLNIKKYYLKFDKKLFLEAIFNDLWKSLELKQRMRHISSTLGDYLPKEYGKAIEILQKVFLQMNYKFSLENMIFQDYVELFGIDDFKTSMAALEHFTIGSSSEFAIRRFIIKYPQKTMKQLTTWAKSKNHHVRRLASEGSRPLLPWAINLSLFRENPQNVLKILELLKDDDSPYVRKSVANSLNDISKDNPKVLKELLKRWIDHTKERDSMLKHGCRTLLKQSDREVLNIFGYAQVKDIELLNFKVAKEIHFGEDLEFSFLLSSKDFLNKLRVEFAIYFLRKNSRHNQKVFKISEGEFLTKEKFISKKYSFKPISTRKYYKGLQKLEIIVNGEVLKREEFMLV